MQPETLNYLLWQKERGLTQTKARPIEKSNELIYEDSLKESSESCRKCSLAINRSQPIWGIGTDQCQVAFVGDVYDYDKESNDPGTLPTTQLSLLKKMIAAIKLSQSDAYICNLVLCPGTTGELTPQHLLACREYLLAQLTKSNPKFIVSMGEIATKNLTSYTKDFKQTVGQWLSFSLDESIRVMPIYHPRDLIREPQLKIPTWQGLQKLMPAIS